MTFLSWIVSFEGLLDARISEVFHNKKVRKREKSGKQTTFLDYILFYVTSQISVSGPLF